MVAVSLSNTVVYDAGHKDRNEQPKGRLQELKERGEHAFALEAGKIPPELEHVRILSIRIASPS